MTNVTSLFNNAGPMAPIKNAGFGPVDFGIYTRPAGFASSESQDFIPADNSKYYIIRGDKHLSMGDPKSTQYKPVAPRDLITKMREIIERSELNIDGITENIQSSHNGSRTFVTYNLPDHKYETPNGDTASLNLLGTTSFDSTFPFIMSAGALQAACLNKQIFTGGNVAVYRSLHTQGLDLDKGALQIMGALDVFQQQADLWQKYYNTPANDLLTFKIFVKITGWAAAITVLKENPNAENKDVNNLIAAARVGNNNGSFNYIWDKYRNRYQKDFGANFWAVYNALTDWSTHYGVGDKALANIRSTQANREKKISEAFEGIAKRLAA